MKDLLVIIVQLVIFTSALTILLTCLRIALDLSGVLI